MHLTNNDVVADLTSKCPRTGVVVRPTLILHQRIDHSYRDDATVPVIVQSASKTISNPNLRKYSREELVQIKNKCGYLEPPMALFNGDVLMLEIIKL